MTPAMYADDDERYDHPIEDDVPVLMTPPEPQNSAAERLERFVQRVRDGWSAGGAIGLEDEQFAQDVNSLLLDRDAVRLREWIAEHRKVCPIMRESERELFAALSEQEAD